MNQETPPVQKTKLEKVRDRFEEWRKNRKKRTPVPESLWKSAVGLSKEYSTFKISKILRLNYMDLKKRVHEAKNGKQTKKVSKSAFVELGFSQSACPAKCVVEMENQHGVKMKMHLNDASVLDLVALWKSLLE